MRDHKFKKSESGLFLPSEDKPISLSNIAMMSLMDQMSPEFASCKKVSAGITAANCVKMTVGTEPNFWIFNREDLDLTSLTYVTGTDSTTIDAIALLGVTVAYAFTGRRKSNTPSVKLVKGTYDDSWFHGFDFLIFNNSGTGKKAIKEFKGANVCVITENKNKGTNGDAAFELYGVSAGLVMNECERLPNSGDTAGAWAIKLGNDTDESEDDVPLTIWDTDYNTSRSLIEALV